MTPLPYIYVCVCVYTHTHTHTHTHTYIYYIYMSYMCMIYISQLQNKALDWVYIRWGLKKKDEDPIPIYVHKRIVSEFCWLENIPHYRSDKSGKIK